MNFTSHHIHELVHNSKNTLPDVTSTNSSLSDKFSNQLREIQKSLTTSQNTRQRSISLQENSKNPPEGKKWKSDKEAQDFFHMYGSNYGVLCGNVGMKHNLLVLDVDSDEALKTALSFGIPETFAVKTPNGYHFYFITSGETHNRSSKELGMDLRGEGGYVVGPGSIVNGKMYSVLHNVTFAEAPQWVVSWTLDSKALSHLHSPSTRSKKAISAISIPATIDPNVVVRSEVLEYLSLMDESISGESGDRTTFTVACRLAIGFNLNRSETFSALKHYNNNKCFRVSNGEKVKDLWTDSELLHKVEQAFVVKERKFTTDYNEVGPLSRNTPQELTVLGYYYRNNHSHAIFNALLNNIRDTFKYTPDYLDGLLQQGHIVSLFSQDNLVNYLRQYGYKVSKVAINETVQFLIETGVMEQYHNKDKAYSCYIYSFGLHGTLFYKHLLNLTYIIYQSTPVAMSHLPHEVFDHMLKINWKSLIKPSEDSLLSINEALDVLLPYFYGENATYAPYVDYLAMQAAKAKMNEIKEEIKEETKAFQKAVDKVKIHDNNISTHRWGNASTGVQKALDSITEKLGSISKRKNYTKRDIQPVLQMVKNLEDITNFTTKATTKKTNGKFQQLCLDTMMTEKDNKIDKLIKLNDVDGLLTSEIVPEEKKKNKKLKTYGFREKRLNRIQCLETSAEIMCYALRIMKAHFKQILGEFGNLSLDVDSFMPQIPEMYFQPVQQQV